MSIWVIRNLQILCRYLADLPAEAQVQLGRARAQCGTFSLYQPLPCGARAGRLNVLANVVRKPLRQIFSEFAGAGPDGESKEYFGTGDVKYHLGTSYDRPTASGKRVHLSLLANPSHLEVSPLLLVSQER